MMKRNYSLYSLFKIALPLVIGCALLLPGSARGQDVGGTYRGFSQSSAGEISASGNLLINSKTNIDWTGLFTLYGNTYAVTGKVDANGVLKFTSRTGLTGTGKWQDLTRGGALVLGTYKLSSGDQGKFILLRNFNNPPEPEMPPDIAGSWRGAFESSLSLMRGTVEWTVQQDRTETGAPGTGFMGQETRDVNIIYDFMGAIDAQGNFVCIGNSVRGFLIEDGKFESGELTGHSMLNDANLDGVADDAFVFSR